MSYPILQYNAPQMGKKGVKSLKPSVIFSYKGPGEKKNGGGVLVCAGEGSKMSRDPFQLHFDLQ